VLVIPPEGPSAPEWTWLSEGVAHALPLSLNRLGVPSLERAEVLKALEGLEIPPVPLTRATSIRVAESLGASRIVVGNIEIEDQTLKLSLRLLDVERGTLSSPLLVSGPLETAVELIDRLAWDIALSGPTKPTLGRGEFLKQRSGVVFEAFKAHAQGLAARNPALRERQIRRSLSLAPGYDEARLSLARLQLDARDFAAAGETLVHIKPDSALARTGGFLRGVALLEQGRYKEAAALYAQLAQQDPTPAVLNNHALALLRLPTSSVKASSVLRKAVEMSPSAQDLPFNLGWALFVEGEPEASAFWLKGLTSRPVRDTHAQLILVWALRSAGHAEEADSQWRSLLTTAPTYQALSSPDLARHFERIFRSERVLSLDGAQRSDAEVVASSLGRAEKLMDKADLEGALAELTRAASLDPYSARVHERLARVHLARGNKERAVTELRMSLWCQDDPGLRAELSGLLKELGRPEEAKELEKPKKDNRRPDKKAITPGPPPGL